MSGLCDNCAYAEWKRTANGRLHPDKSGRCTFLKKHPRDDRLPAAFYWIGSAPNPAGGAIERGDKVRTMCVFKQGVT